MSDFGPSRIFRASQRIPPFAGATACHACPIGYYNGNRGLSASLLQKQSPRIPWTKMVNIILL